MCGLPLVSKLYLVSWTEIFCKISSFHFFPAKKVFYNPIFHGEKVGRSKKALVVSRWYRNINKEKTFDLIRKAV